MGKFKIGSREFTGDCDLCELEDVECVMLITEEGEEYAICDSCAKCLLEKLKVAEKLKTKE
jgi:hypothetical protein